MILNGLPWKRKEIILLFLRLHPSTAFCTLLLTMMATPFQEMGIPNHLTCLLRHLYAGQEAIVRTGHRTTDWFQIGKRVRNAVLGCNLKNDRMISVRFQGKPFNITVIQVYAPTIMLKKLKLNGSMKTYKTF